MSDISYMEKLLDGVEVEWKTVEAIFDLRNGYTPSKSNSEYWNDGTVPWFGMEDIRANGRILSDSIQYITKSAVKGRLFPEGLPREIALRQQQYEYYRDLLLSFPKSEEVLA